MCVWSEVCVQMSVDVLVNVTSAAWWGLFFFFGGGRAEKDQVCVRERVRVGGWHPSVCVNVSASLVQCVCVYVFVCSWHLRVFNTPMFLLFSHLNVFALLRAGGSARVGAEPRGATSGLDARRAEPRSERHGASGAARRRAARAPPGGGLLTSPWRRSRERHGEVTRDSGRVHTAQGRCVMTRELAPPPGGWVETDEGCEEHTAMGRLILTLW